MSTASGEPSKRGLSAVRARFADWVARRRDRRALPDHPVHNPNQQKTYASERHLAGIAAELVTRRGPR